MHRISLATLIISLGLLVDNGIVVAEEIGKRLFQGEKPSGRGDEHRKDAGDAAADLIHHDRADVRAAGAWRPTPPASTCAPCRRSS